MSAPCVPGDLAVCHCCICFSLRHASCCRHCRSCCCSANTHTHHTYLLSDMQPSPHVMIGFNSTVLHTVPASPPQKVEPEFMIAFCINTADLVLPTWPMSICFLLAPKGPAQRVTALHSTAQHGKCEVSLVSVCAIV